MKPDIAAIEARALAASPGAYAYSPKEGLVLCDDCAIAMLNDGDGLEGDTDQADRNGELFAHAREDVLALVAWVREIESDPLFLAYKRGVEWVRSRSDEQLAAEWKQGEAALRNGVFRNELERALAGVVPDVPWVP